MHEPGVHHDARIISVVVGDVGEVAVRVIHNQLVQTVNWVSLAKLLPKNLRDSLVRPPGDDFFRKIVAQNQRAVSLQVEKHQFRVANELIVGYNDILSLILDDVGWPWRKYLPGRRVLTRPLSTTQRIPRASISIPVLKVFSLLWLRKRTKSLGMFTLNKLQRRAISYLIHYGKNDEKLVMKIKACNFPYSANLGTVRFRGLCDHCCPAFGEERNV